MNREQTSAHHTSISVTTYIYLLRYSIRSNLSSPDNQLHLYLTATHTDCLCLVYHAQIIHTCVWAHEAQGNMVVVVCGSEVRMNNIKENNQQATIEMVMVIVVCRIKKNEN